MQVYHQDMWWVLLWIFVAITAMSSMFLWLEILQATQNWRQYYGYDLSLLCRSIPFKSLKPIYSLKIFFFRSPYNIIDLFVYALALAGSVCQIYNIMTEDPRGDMATLSFSVLFVFLHFVRPKRL